jgi:hypothetical protein
MRLQEMEPPSKEDRKHRFRLVGELARKWDRAKLTNQFDDIVSIFQKKYRIDVSYDLVGIAFHGKLYTKPLRLIMRLIAELDKKRGRF